MKHNTKNNTRAMRNRINERIEKETRSELGFLLNVLQREFGSAGMRAAHFPELAEIVHGALLLGAEIALNEQEAARVRFASDIATLNAALALAPLPDVQIYATKNSAGARP